MKYTDMQLKIFAFIEALGFDKNIVKRVEIDADILTVAVKGEYAFEEITHVFNIRAERG